MVEVPVEEEVEEVEEVEVEEVEAVEETPEPVVAAPPSVDLVGQIRGLKELLDEGLIDADEFKEMKAALIATLKASDGVAL